MTCYVCITCVCLVLTITIRVEKKTALPISLRYCEVNKKWIIFASKRKFLIIPPTGVF